MTKRGFSLVELLLVIIVLALISTMSISFFRGVTDAERWEETRTKMDGLRVAILGDGTNSQGKKFGYFGDIGRMPATVSNLYAAEAPPYAFDSSRGIGSGWRGPYYNRGFSTAWAADLDAWGRPFVLTPTSIQSLGSDNAVGGTGHATDLSVSFPATSKIATVRGVVIENDTPLSGETVHLFYPVNGSLTTFTAVTDAQGAFVFNNVPFGVRAIEVSSLSPVLGPVVFDVDQPEMWISPELLNRKGRSSVAVKAGTLAVGGSAITVLNPRNTSSGANSSSLTLAYTVPVGAGSRPVLVVGTSGEDTNSDCLPTTTTFGGTAMTAVYTGVTGLSSGGTQGGMGLYAKSVVAGQSANIVSTFTGSNTARLIHAVTLTDVASPTAEATVFAKSTCCDTGGTIRPLTEGAAIVTLGHIGNPVIVDPVGVGHVRDSSRTEAGGGGSASSLGHVFTTSLATLSGIGWTSASTNRMGVILAAFSSLAYTTSLQLTSTYPASRTLDFITARWSNSANMKSLSLGGVSENAPHVPSGTRVDIQGALSIPANSAGTLFEISFDALMAGIDYVVVLEWTTGDKDTVHFTL